MQRRKGIVFSINETPLIFIIPENVNLNMFTNMNSKWTTDLNEKLESVKPPEDKHIRKSR